MKVDSASRHAERLMDLLVDCGPLTAAEACEKLEWSRGRFATAIRYAREHLCPELGVAIPTATPGEEWTYQVTTEWQPVEDGASYSLGLVESRLIGLARDVAIVKPHLTRGSKEWRRANFLDKHLTHIVGTLKEIDCG
jgi:hypothetical protein